MLHKLVQLEHSEGHLYKLLQVYKLMGIQDKDVLPVTKAQNLSTEGVLSAEMRAEVQAAHFRPEGEELTEGQLDGFSFKDKEKTAPGVALVAFEIIGFVE